MGPFELGGHIGVECDKCGRGRSLFEHEPKDPNAVIVCFQCKNEFTVLDGIINSITSDLPFAIYDFISTRSYSGIANIKVGETQYICFPSPLKQVYKVFVTPYAGCDVATSRVDNNGFWLISGCTKDSQDCTIGSEAKVSWDAYGNDVDFNEAWRQLLVYSRQAFLAENYLGSILLSEIGFESFIDASLSEGYKKNGLDDDSISRFLVNTGMVDKVNPLMNNLFGLKLSNSSVWQDWEKRVLRWRNNIAHGSKLSATKDEAQLVFKTVIKAIFYFHKTVFEKCNDV